MRRKSVAVLAAAFLAGGSTVALAQSGFGGSQQGQGVQGQDFGSNSPGIRRDWTPGALSPNAERYGGPVQYNQTWPAGPLSPYAEGAVGQGQINQGQMNAQTRFNQRVALRRLLRQAGFEGIRILDTAYLVHATTPDGRPVMMVLSPSDDSNATMTSSLGSSQSFGGQDGSQSPRGQAYGGSQGMGQGMDQQNSNQQGTNQNASPTVDLRELSARMEDPGLLEQGQVRSYLQSRGFSNVSDLSRNGNIYTGTANWFGQQVNLRVDARNGFVIEPSHMTQDQVRNMLGQYGWDFAGQIERQGTSYRVEAARNGRPFTLWIDARTGEINRQIAANQSSGG